MSSFHEMSDGARDDFSLNMREEEVNFFEEMSSGSISAEAYLPETIIEMVEKAFFKVRAFALEGDISVLKGENTAKILLNSAMQAAFKIEDQITIERLKQEYAYIMPRIFLRETKLRAEEIKNAWQGKAYLPGGFLSAMRSMETTIRRSRINEYGEQIAKSYEKKPREPNAFDLFQMELEFDTDEIFHHELGVLEEELIEYANSIPQSLHYFAINNPAITIMSRAEEVLDALRRLLDEEKSDLNHRNLRTQGIQFPEYALTGSPEDELQTAEQYYNQAGSLIDDMKKVQSSDRDIQNLEFMHKQLADRIQKTREDIQKQF